MARHSEPFEEIPVEGEQPTTIEEQALDAEWNYQQAIKEVGDARNSLELRETRLSQVERILGRLSTDSYVTHHEQIVNRQLVNRSATDPNQERANTTRLGGEQHVAPPSAWQSFVGRAALRRITDTEHDSSKSTDTFEDYSTPQNMFGRYSERRALKRAQRAKVRQEDVAWAETVHGGGYGAGVKGEVATLLARREARKEVEKMYREGVVVDIAVPIRPKKQTERPAYKSKAQRELENKEFAPDMELVARRRELIGRKNALRSDTSSEAAQERAEIDAEITRLYRSEPSAVANGAKPESTQEYTTVQRTMVLDSRERYIVLEQDSQYIERKKALIAKYIQNDGEESIDDGHHKFLVELRELIEGYSNGKGKFNDGGINHGMIVYRQASALRRVSTMEHIHAVHDTAMTTESTRRTQREQDNAIAINAAEKEKTEADIAAARERLDRALEDAALKERELYEARKTLKKK